MTKLVVVAACVWLAACSGNGEGDPPQMPSLLGGGGGGGGDSHAGDGQEPSGGGDVVPPGSGDVVPPGGGDVVPPDGDEPKVVYNVPPELVSLAAEQSTLEVDTATVLTAQVRDAENDRFYLWWDSSCGIVSVTGDDKARAIFIAPSEPATCTVTLQVQDADLQRTREYPYELQVIAAAGLEDSDD